jgi:site-specific recombinase XerD
VANQQISKLACSAQQEAAKGRNEPASKARGSRKTQQADAAAKKEESWVRDFRAWLKKLDRSPHSIRAYLSDVQLFAAWFAEQTDEPFAVDAVTERDVQDWRDHLESTRKPATVNRKLAALSTFYQWAGKAELVEHDPTAYVNGVEQEALAPKALTKKNLNRILREARKGGKRDEAMLELLAATGLRVSELAELQVGDL